MIISIIMIIVIIILFRIRRNLTLVREIFSLQTELNKKILRRLDNVETTVGGHGPNTLWDIHPKLVYGAEDTTEQTSGSGDSADQ